ncbi:MAG TPA: hypothetical protein VFD19_00270 [Clostridia bacterium]|nr:hypothetical protein [Clostridia bacterium]
MMVMKARKPDIPLVDRLDLGRLRSLAIIGMGKNAGKTTVLNHILAACDRPGFARKLAVTSIGRDGEKEDLVTGGVKPRIYVKEDNLVATARDSLNRCDAVLEILALTKMHTALGEVVIARARSNGYIELAGPSMAQDLALCESLFRDAEPDCLLLIDGALSRKSPAGGGLTQAVILVAGAANAASVSEWVEETARQVSLLTLPALEEADRCACLDVSRDNKDVRAVIMGQGQATIRRALELASLVGSGKQVAEALQPEDRLLLVRGAVTDRMVTELLSTDAMSGMTLAAEDGTRFFIGEKSLAKVKHRQVKLAVLHELILPLVCVNPMRRDGSLADSDELVGALSAVIDRPVADLGSALI